MRAVARRRGKPARERRGGRPWRKGALGVLVVAVGLYYLFVVTAGFQRAPTFTAFYDLLAEGFRSGHLHLSVEPHPSLLAQDDPFDPRHRRLWLWDASLHEGHYYLYWGPTPAVLAAPASRAPSGSTVRSATSGSRPCSRSVSSSGPRL